MSSVENLLVAVRDFVRVVRRVLAYLGFMVQLDCETRVESSEAVATAGASWIGIDTSVGRINLEASSRLEASLWDKVLRSCIRRKRLSRLVQSE